VFSSESRSACLSVRDTDWVLSEPCGCWKYVDAEVFGSVAAMADCGMTSAWF